MIYEITKSSYPETLQNAPGVPKRLFIRGKLPDVSKYKFLCVVGSRHPSEYAEEAVAKIIAGLEGYPISIVSGLAIGIDGMAHQAALKAGLHCTAFPGSGLNWDVIYPSSNLPIAKQIYEAGGAVISKHPPFFQSDTFMFAERNKFMAGMSHATLIIEADHGSGSLMTAKYAENFDRDVLAVPGSIFNNLSYGPHMLIHRGAGLVTSSDDLLEALGFVPPSRMSKSALRLASLEQLSRQIIETLSRGEISVDNLALELNIPVHKLNTDLSFLELEGLIEIRGTVLRAI